MFAKDLIARLAVVQRLRQTNVEDEPKEKAMKIKHTTIYVENIKYSTSYGKRVGSTNPL